MDKITNEHEFKESLVVDIFYPNHHPRKESNLFARTKHKMIDVEDTPCFVCGSKELREVHHFHLEWAFSDAVDWDIMKKIHPDFDWTTFKSAEDFVDSEYNMMILCQNHHRHVNHGIHNLPFPIWEAQRYMKADFKLFEGDPIANSATTPDDSPDAS